MDNYQIADAFSLLAKILDIHGENSFKSKSYSSAAFAIEKIPSPLSEMPADKIPSIKGIGASSAQKIIELLETGKLNSLEEIISRTPKGVLEMLQIKGIGPKKIHTIWKEMEIESIGELHYACKENRLKLYKGFGEKTQQNIIDTIEFYLKSKGSFLYAQVAPIAPLIKEIFEDLLPQNRIEISGAFKRQMEIIHELEFVVAATESDMEKALKTTDHFELTDRMNGSLILNSDLGIKIKIHPANVAEFISTLIFTSSSEEFNNEWNRQFGEVSFKEVQTEAEYFSLAQMAMIEAPLRESASIITLARNNEIPSLIQTSDIRGIIHCHSNWSDGSNTVEEMAVAAKNRGLEYLVISDHSKSAFYAQGLYEEKIREQHLYVDELNKKLFPFKIFKSIESDILNDGSLDYSDQVLASFDLVIASIHSNLKMTQEKAMMRIMKAIENPYTSILGHMTGRLLLSRQGYPVDHEAIIDACAANHVVIELNAHPSRLDIDWRHIQYAIKKNVLISIDPDSHHTDGLDDIKYGVLVAQKALVRPEDNLSSMPLESFERFISDRKKLKNI
jgi:DNA polymerase (family 10)